MMAEWAVALIEDLEAEERGLAGILGLHPGMTGEDFEHALGQFMELVRVFPTVQRLRLIGRKNADDVSPAQDEWLTAARHRQRRVLDVINRSLCKEFGLQRIDAAATQTTYEKLCTALKALPGMANQIFSVTTNYDRSGEIGWASVGFQCDDGAHYLGSHQVRHLAVQTMRPWSDQKVVPHLHLHGAVGWVRDHAGIRVDAIQSRAEETRAPAVLYPDPKKDPVKEGDAETYAIWEKFLEGLEGADCIVVIGHSLNDRHVRDALNKRYEAGAPLLVVRDRRRDGWFGVDFGPFGDFSRIADWTGH